MSKDSNSSTDTKKTWGSGGLGGEGFRMVATILLMAVTPFFCLWVWYVSYSQTGSDGVQTWGTKSSVSSFVNNELPAGSSLSDFLSNVVPKVMQWTLPQRKVSGSTDAVFELFGEFVWSKNAILAWKHIGIYMFFQICLMKLVPGKEFRANVTKTGHIPVYKENGVACWCIAVLSLFVVWYMDIKSLDGVSSIPIYLYNNFGLLLSCMNTFALTFCAILYVKGLNWPSTKDSGTNGNLVDDYWWGTELYPRIFGVDVKQFSNCRFGMMYWQLGIVCYALAQYEREGFLSSSMFISVTLQTVYIFKFFWWETGYFNSMDIQHDRAGYYICWGCFVWLPSLYTMHSFYLVAHPHLISPFETLLILVFGLGCVYCNYDCDKQRIDVRQSDGKCKVFGEDPVIIRAKYTTEEGEVKSSILLASGWWGMASHFHYLFEILAAISWCLPAMLAAKSSTGGWLGVLDHPGSWFYWVFLCILLFDRSFRDDKRCAAKYGKYWDEYRNKVPFKVIPGVV